MRPVADTLSAILSLTLGAALTLCACTATPTASVAAASAAAAPLRLYVARRDWHIDVGFAVQDLGVPLSALRRQFPQARYLMFGFGDRHYLEAGNPRLPDMLAALWPGEGVVLVTALQGSPEQAFGRQQVIELPILEAQAREAQARITLTLALQQGQMQSDGPGPYEGSLYLRAAARYSALHTCNTWAAEVLAAAGLGVRSRGVIFAGQLWGQLQRLNRLGAYSARQALRE